MTKASKVLTSDMVKVNATQAQTGWVNFAGTALRFYKRHLPSAPEGAARYAHILRNAQGETWRIYPQDNEKILKKCDSKKAGSVELLNRAYEIFMGSVKGKEPFAVLIDDMGRLYSVERCAALDIDGSKVK
jgi:hypothetical protein